MQSEQEMPSADAREGAYNMDADVRLPPNMAISFSRRIYRDGDGDELWIDVDNIYQEGVHELGGDGRHYRVRIFEDGFTEIRYHEDMKSEGATHRGETFQSALEKAKDAGMTDATWQRIQITIDDGFNNYNMWLMTMEKVSRSTREKDKQHIDPTDGRPSPRRYG